MSLMMQPQITSQGKPIWSGPPSVPGEWTSSFTTISNDDTTIMKVQDSWSQDGESKSAQGDAAAMGGRGRGRAAFRGGHGRGMRR